MSEKSVPEIVIGENIHIWLNVNVFKGTYDKKPAIHKYIEIYEPTTITSHTASLEIYKSLECENICKLLDYGVEEPSMPPIYAWEKARSEWENRMMTLNLGVWNRWYEWQEAKKKIPSMELEQLKLLEKMAEEEAEKNKLAWFDMNRKK